MKGINQNIFEINLYEDYQNILDHIPGAILIDLDGKVMYMNEQCADYIHVKREDALGDHIVNVFPGTLMMGNLYIHKSEILFYHSFGIGISIHVPVFKNGKRIGLLEYDVVQNSEALYDFAEQYAMFIDKEMGTTHKGIVRGRKTKYSLDDMIGISKEMIDLKEEVLKAAASNSTVVIFGETGTGKELVAHSIHNLSERSEKAFVKLNAASIPESLVESELFGYEGGTFTGADKGGRKGKFELANNGTLYIDEVNQMPSSIQPKLLRVLQEQEIERIGGQESIPIDVRLIVTTNEDLREMVKTSRLRKDLFYRLHVVPIVIPPLRERKEDIPLLIDHYVKIYSERMGKSIRVVEKKIYREFAKYSWPGNIRELQNVLERAVGFSVGETLSYNKVMEDSYINVSNHEGQAKSQSVKEEEKAENILEKLSPIERAKERAEVRVIKEALEISEGKMTKAAKLLKISRPLLYQKIARLGIKRK